MSLLTLMAINCPSIFSPRLTIIMVFAGRSAIGRATEYSGIAPCRLNWLTSIASY